MSKNDKRPSFLTSHHAAQPLRRITFVPSTTQDVAPEAPGVHFIVLNKPSEVHKQIRDARRRCTHHGLVNLVGAHH